MANSVARNAIHSHAGPRRHYALFFRKAAVEITFEGDTYLVIPQSAILALVRDSDVEDWCSRPLVPVPGSQLHKL